MSAFTDPLDAITSKFQRTFFKNVLHSFVNCRMLFNRDEFHSIVQFKCISALIAFLNVDYEPYKYQIYYSPPTQALKKMTAFLLYDLLFSICLRSPILASILLWQLFSSCHCFPLARLPLFIAKTDGNSILVCTEAMLTRAFNVPEN